MISKCSIYLQFQDGSGRPSILRCERQRLNHRKHFLFREIPLTLQKSKPRAIRFEVSTNGRNEKTKPWVSVVAPLLRINETRLVVHWSGWRCQMEHMPNLSPNNILTSNICNLNGIKPNQIELSKEAIFFLWGPYFTL